MEHGGGDCPRSEIDRLDPIEKRLAAQVAAILSIAGELP
jgi:hypothetical protein